MNKSTNYLVLTLLSLIILPSVSSLCSVNVWDGYAYVDGSLAPNGTMVSAYINGVNLADSFAVGSGLFDPPQVPYYYKLNVESSNGNNVTFRINGVQINGTNTTPQPWSTSQCDVMRLNLTMAKLATGATCYYNSGCSGGYCCNGATAINDLTLATSGTCQSSACSAGGNTGGGGGGGGGTTTLPSQTITMGSITAGGTGSASFTKDVVVTQIDITASSSATGVTIKVEETTKPSGATIAISSWEGGTYKYLKITPSIKNSKIDKVIIKFKVPKSWLSTTYDKDKVTLKKWFNNEWIDLTTKKTSEDSLYVYYEAETTGFSDFAVTAEKLTVITSVTKAQLIQYANDWVKGVITKVQLINYANIWVGG